ncbi:FAD-binding oxidoreductase [Candidatus Aminicenantes bacterium AH-873-B07]|nr:FAD-binding oxidoreductase [Candidatus Aminicenantes bacterium AH-873-B07]
MILDSFQEVKLYVKESIELPDILKNRFPKIQFVYQPKNIQEIQKIFSYSRKNKIPIIPRGAATSGIGNITPVKKSIMMDLTNLNKILDFDRKKKIIYFEAGLRWWELIYFLKNHSLSVYTYPTSLFSTIGGWLCTGGYGINSFKYGHISNFVDAIEVVIPNKTMTVNRNDREFKYFIGTEGQMGIISKIKLKVRELIPSKSYLIFFNNISEAFSFLSDILKLSKIQPVHISFYDRYRLQEKNLLLNENISFPELEGIFIVYEDPLLETTILKLIERKKGILAEDYLTKFLWNERFFPLSVKRFYPSILGCEIILPIENLNLFIIKVRKFSKNYNIHLSIEATLINKKEAIVFIIFPSDYKKFIYYFHLLLVYSLNHIALKFGAKPYGIGIWNLPLLKKKFSNKEFKDYMRFKKEKDPLNLINPGKSLSIYHRITYFLKFIYLISALLSNNYYFFKPFFKILSLYNKMEKRAVPEIEACSNCGACTIVCPSYLINNNEIVTAKGKLFILKNLLNGSSISKSIAEKIFLCLHCHLCEYVCQSKLELMPVWDRLETIVEKTFKRPEEKINEFIKQVESHPSYAKLLDLLNISSNNNQERIKNV